MKNGFHDHYCPHCKHGFVCAKVTHCKDEFETLCPDHKFEDSRVELGDDCGYEPDDPKHPRWWS